MKIRIPSDSSVCRNHVEISASRNLTIRCCTCVRVCALVLIWMAQLGAEKTSTTRAESRGSKAIASLKRRRADDAMGSLDEAGLRTKVEVWKKTVCAVFFLSLSLSLSVRL